MSIIDNFDFTHPLDRQTLNALEAIPGFTKVTKAYMRLVSDRQIHLNNMSSKLLLGPNQLPEIYNLLPPVCERLGIEEPPLYLELDPNPNAYTRGDNLPEITLTSGLLDYMTNEEIQVVMAHECGHIICHHVLYQQIGTVVLSGAAGFIGIPVVGQALDYAFLNWMRCSEFSADRAAALFAGDSKKVARFLLRFSGCSRNLSDSVDLDLFMQQAASFKDYMGDSGWNKFLGVMSYAESDHPLNAVRANEIASWMEYPEVQRVVDDLDSGAFKPAVTYFSGQSAAAGAAAQTPGAGVVCQQCSTVNVEGSAFCARCGASLAPTAGSFCPQCGARNEGGAAFCGSCGQPLAAAGGQSAQPAPAQTSTDKIRESIQQARSAH